MPLPADGLPSPAWRSRSDDVKASLLGAIDLFKRREAPAGRVADGPIEQAASALRRSLALVGWWDPASLLPSWLSAEDRVAALERVAEVCEVDAGGTSWLLRDDARRTELTSVGPSEVRDMLADANPSDRVGRAIRRAYCGGYRLAELAVDELEALVGVEACASGHAPFLPDPAELRRVLSIQVRVEGYDRMLGAGFVGRGPILRKLRTFCADPSEARPVAALYVHGTGGVGKSTLGAALLRSLLGEPHAVPVHLDFDRGDLSIEEPLGMTLEVLRQVGAAHPAQDGRLKSVRDRLRRRMRDRSRGDGGSAWGVTWAEAVTLTDGALGWLRPQGGGVVLVLDTFEQVEGADARGLRALRRWLLQLVKIADVPRLRVVVLGRTDPSDNGAVVELAFDDAPLSVEALGDLPVDDAIDFLAAVDIGADAALAVYRTLGGNPLVLRLVRELFESGGAAELERIVLRASGGALPQAIVQGVLYDRFLKHLPDPVARHYAHPGLVLPVITTELIRKVLAPVLGEGDMTPARARQVFESLAQATWLVRRQGDALSQRPDVRRLLLTLMAADADRGSMVARIRTAALLHHRGRRTIEDRAQVAYHLLAGVKGRDDLTLLHLVDMQGTGPFLRRHSEDLPDIARTFVSYADFRHKDGIRSVPTPGMTPEQALKVLPDDLWATYLLGDASLGGGEGERLVDKGDLADAYALWDRRRMHVVGRAPTFVIRALAEMAEWDSPVVDVAELAGELAATVAGTSTMTRAIVRRIFWVARFALLSRPEAFEEPSELGGTIVSLLARVLERRRDDGDAASCDLASVAEALSLGSFTIIPERCLRRKNVGHTTPRAYLQRGIWKREAREWLTSFEALVVLQADYARRVSGEAGDCLRQGEERLFGALADGTGGMLQAAQGAIRDLGGSGSDDIDRQGPLFSQVVTARVGTGATDRRKGEVILFRGTTPELHRPARQALVECLSVCSPPARLAFLRQLTEPLSVVPRSFEPKVLASRLDVDPGFWCLALVRFCDRARVLGRVLDTAGTTFPNSVKVARVQATFRRWDTALTGGLGSDWPS